MARDHLSFARFILGAVIRPKRGLEQNISRTLNATMRWVFDRQDVLSDDDVFPPAFNGRDADDFTRIGMLGLALGLRNPQDPYLQINGLATFFNKMVALLYGDDARGKKIHDEILATGLDFDKLNALLTPVMNVPKEFRNDKEPTFFNVLREYTVEEYLSKEPASH